LRSPTARTLAHLRGQGVAAESVEKWIPVPRHPGGGVRRDLFGIIDVIAIGPKIVAIQSTSGSNHSARVKKAEAAQHLRSWLAAGAQFAVWSWAKKPHKKKDGSKGAKRWALRASEAYLDGLTLKFRPAVNVNLDEEAD
jgi:hypothetical protein